MSKLIIIALGTLLMLQQCMAEEKWYKPVDIGQHIDQNNVKEEQINKSQIKKIFKKGTLFQEDARRMYVNLKREWFTINGADYIKKYKDDKIFYLDNNDHPITANVYMFSKSKAKIHIKFIYGHSRWHHYYIVLGNFLLERDSYIDDVFNLNVLEKKYSYSFKGISHGSSVEEIEDILGRGYYEYAGQSPQYRNIYYEKYNIEIIIQDWVVKYVQEGKPDWMKSEMKFKNK